MVTLGREMQERQDDAGGLMRSAMGKARGLALRVSLVLAHMWWAAEPGMEAPPAVIPERAFAAAALMVAEYLVPMAERVYGDAACPARDRNAATLARWIVKERPEEVHVRHMLRDVRLPGLGEAERIHEAAALLIDAAWLLPMPGGTGFQQRGRAAYPVSPRLWDALA